MHKVLFISLLLLSCTESTTQNTTKRYFDLAGLVHQQIVELSRKKPLIHKNLAIEEKKEVFETNKIDWKKEFELFLQADLNKQSYHQSYKKQETPQTLVYTLEKNQDLPVRLLKIEFDEVKKPRRIEALVETKNYLYQSRRHLLMIFCQGQLTNYQIEGWQELFVGKRKKFKIDGIMMKKR